MNRFDILLLIAAWILVIFAFFTLLNLKAHGWEDHTECFRKITPTPIEITPTATPSATPTEAPTSQSSSSGVASSIGTPDASQPSCTIMFDAPKLQGFERISSTSVKFSWWKSIDDGVTSQSIVYGLEQGKPLFGVNNLPKDQTNITLNDLPENQIVWAQILAFKGKCAEMSNWLDP